MQASIAAAESQRQKLMEAQMKRVGGTKGALNKVFKGSAVGSDITSKVDTSKMVCEDPYKYYGDRYTNNIARMQGFDSPAKLVTEQEFDVLAKACGDIFFRTLNPTNFNGKDMSGEEFASQIYLADKLEMNGPGGRVYGDGLYVASTSWTGGKLRGLSQTYRDEAYHSSAAYGNGRHKTLEMTWLRPPKLIKQTDLFDMWSKLTPAQQKKFGDHENTYACALGYDGMYCNGVDYIVVWNRSLIAVKHK